MHAQTGVGSAHSGSVNCGPSSRAHSRARIKRKMDRVLGLAVLWSILCDGCVWGKYVKGVVNTKEVRCCTGDVLFIYFIIIIL